MPVDLLSFSELIPGVRRLPRPARALVLELIKTVIEADDVEFVARRALERARTMALDAAAKKRYG